MVHSRKNKKNLQLVSSPTNTVSQSVSIASSRPRPSLLPSPLFTHHSSSFSPIRQRRIYKEAIVEIYESLYHYQRHRTGEEEQAVVRCIKKWYDGNSTFENPLVHAIGLAAIVHNFSLMSLIPGHTWSELGDVCESEDYLGNRVVVFSHTLHFTLLGPGWAQPPTVFNTPHHSHPPTPFLHTPTVLSAASSPFTSYRLAPRLQSVTTVWPLAFLASRFSPVHLIRQCTSFHLTLSTTLRFNEQAKIVSHEDRWGIKETIEFLAPRPINAAYGLLRSVLSLGGDWLGRILHPTRTAATTASSEAGDELPPSGAGLGIGVEDDTCRRLSVASDAYSSE
ncbi:hypothetical protein CROQUDRAFT_655976 [Cronartium quercuum f. sp. fusiforme G11]|uniref:Uncharacterized protein n=1 Tax=Cronartium quercuum f. sp. fusiforme G11 TaxID=708437 RepID=A0A9P6TCR4_9BASI|nr:hypothetical protein CROQUDRAFT_655976 [Cronartium quercuum f. sp. fusiforme G11]